MSKEMMALITWAWRSLYAETTRAHIEGGTFSLDQAVKDTVRMVYSRVKAYGHRWRQWYLHQRGWRDGTRKIIPEEHQHYHLISCDEEGNYEIAHELKKSYNDIVLGRTIRPNPVV